MELCCDIDYLISLLIILVSCSGQLCQGNSRMTLAMFSLNSLVAGEGINWCKSWAGVNVIVSVLVLTCSFG